jgi:GMP synthase-like glutamine amidotransferase
MDHVLRVAPEFEVVARSDYTPIHAVRHRSRPIFGVQSHPEHCRCLMDLDQQEYRHQAWAALPDAAIEAAEGPRMLESFARFVHAAL